MKQYNPIWKQYSAFIELKWWVLKKNKIFFFQIMYCSMSNKYHVLGEEHYPCRKRKIIFVHISHTIYWYYYSLVFSIISSLLINTEELYSILEGQTISQLYYSALLTLEVVLSLVTSLILSSYFPASPSLSQWARHRPLGFASENPH